MKRGILARRLGAVCALAASLSSPAMAESARLVSGDFPPFVYEGGARQGFLTDIVRAAFAAEGVDITVDFMPWKRGYLMTRKGIYIGTFPYAHNAEREAEFLYSEPIYIDRVRLFAIGGGSVDDDWHGRTVCLPVGYDMEQTRGWMARQHVAIEQPPRLEDCFHMLASHRVDAVPISEAVGNTMVVQMYGRGNTIHPLDGVLGSDITHFIVSRRRVDAQAWIDRFNRGLALIHANGTYDRLRDAK